jgi:hypothetical protein
MSPRLFRLRLAWMPVLALLGILGLAANGLAQQQAVPSGMSSDAAKTGAGPRGTGAAPSSNPTMNTMPASPPESTTGSGPRGTPGSPSTNPGAPTTQTPQQTR